MVRRSHPRQAPWAAVVLALAVGGCTPTRAADRSAAVRETPDSIVSLPRPGGPGVTLTRALEARRSVRDLSPRPLTEEELSALLWAAQGITHEEGYRTAPSAGALYPLELYVATASGLFHYLPDGHRLARVTDADPRGAMQRAALGQPVVGRAPAVFVLAAAYGRTAAKYGAEHGTRFVHLEAGHAAQNLLLQAVALDLGAVPVGAFDQDVIAGLLALPAEQTPLYLVAVGEPVGR